jgi:transketolase
MIQNQAINAIRALGVDAINKANSGHPGIVLGAAPMAYTLWANHLRVNPNAPMWYNRDRFVLSAGHGSALLYSLLHLSGFNVTIDDLKNFRQTDSKTPGHPEFGHTEGVDATTGPLGQGVAMATGMAMAERFLASKFNKERFEIFNHFTYVICGDGDLMEGVAQEAVSLAGHLGLGKLIVLYDSNDISLDGDTSTSFSDKTIAKFEAMGWHTEFVKDGNNIEAINESINRAKAETNKPSLIEIKTIIGFGAPNQGTHKVHGAPIGEEGSKVLREQLKWEYDPFNVPELVYEHFKKTVKTRGIMEFTKSEDLLDGYKKEYPELHKELMNALENKIDVDLGSVLPTFDASHQAATREDSNVCLNAVKDAVPYLMGGSADLSSSTKAIFKNEPAFTRDQVGRNVMFGVREFAMAAIVNGMALHQGVRPFASTFFVFSDYLKPALRLGALMSLPTLYIFTHDSVAVGEDGPTHEPIEQLAMLRSIPNVQVIRPADGNETSAAYRVALETNDQPTVLVLTRQKLPTVTQPSIEEFRRGAYILSEAKNNPIDGILIATGSEVHLALEAQKQLEEENIFTRVVSMPSMELFNRQSAEYKESVLPRKITKRLAIEMGSSFGWHQYVGLDGQVLGIDTFGASGPAEEVLPKFGFTANNIVKVFKNIK